MAACDCPSDPHKVWCAKRREERERRVSEAARPVARRSGHARREANRDAHVAHWRRVVSDNERLGRTGGWGGGP